MSNQLEIVQAQPLAPTQPTPAEMMSVMLKSGITAENVAAFERLAELQWKFEERQAERDFARDFATFQSEIVGKIHATRSIHNKDGSVRSTYAPLEDLQEQLAPYLQKYGLSISFSEPADVPPGRVVRICTVRHSSGYKHECRNSMRVGQGPMGCNETQSDGSAITYAKRYALCDALAIPIDKDTDARVEEGPVTGEQAFELERRVKESNSNVAAFLKLAGAANFASIPSDKYAMLDEMLSKKERRGQ